MRYNIVLAVLLLTGLAILFLPSRGQRIQIEKPLFTEQMIRELKEVKLERSGETIRIQRVDKPVKLTAGKASSPFQLEVFTPDRCSPSEDAITRLSMALQMTAPRNALNETSEAFGFEKPEYRLVLRSDRSETELILGKEHPFSGRRYARVSGNSQTLLLDEAVLRPALDADFCDRTPLKVPASQLRAVEIEGVMKLQRTGSAWLIDGALSADRELVERALDQFLAQKALGSVDPANVSGPALGKVTLSLENPKGEASVESIQLIRGNGNEIIATIAGSALGYRFDDAVTRLLSIKADGLRDRSLLKDVRFDDLAALCLETSEHRLNIEGTGECEGPPAKLPEKLAREEMIQRFERLQVLSYESLPGRLFSKVPPICEVNGSFRDGRRLRFLVLGEVESMVQNRPEASQPREYLFDLGTIHARGIISAEMAQLLCKRS